MAKTIKKFTDKDFLELYNEKRSDREISKILKASYSAVYLRRCKLKKTANFQPKLNPKELANTRKFKMDKSNRKTAERYKTDEEFRKITLKNRKNWRTRNPIKEKEIKAKYWEKNKDWINNQRSKNNG